jgi:hypothetical protein
MGQAFNAGPRRPKWAPGSNRRMLIVAGIILGFVLFLALLPVVKRLSLDHRFAVPESWSQMCLGGEDTVAELLDWSEADAEAPEITRSEPSYNEYLCEWTWRDAEGGGQVLTMKIEVDDSRAYGPYDTSIEEGLGGGEWHTDYESLNGWEHGICRQRFSDTLSSTYQCIASSSNLRLTIANRDLSDTDYEDKYFGPGAVSVEDLTVEIGELVRSTFRR